MGQIPEGEGFPPHAPQESGPGKDCSTLTDVSVIELYVHKGILRPLGCVTNYVLASFRYRRWC